VNIAIDMYNQVSNQWDNGFIITLYAELIMLRGYDRIFIKQLSIPRTSACTLKIQKDRMVGFISSIANGEFPIYRPPPPHPKSVGHP